LLTCIVLGRIVLIPGYLHASIALSLLLVIETVDLVRYLNRTNRKLAQFFSALPDRASSIRFDESGLGGSFKDLSERLEQVNCMFQEERREKEARNNYLNYLVDKIGTGIITYGEGGKVDMINPAAKAIFAEKDISELASLNRFNPEFEKQVNDLALNQKSLMRIVVKGELFYLSVQKSLFKLQDEVYWMISFQDINSELDKKELDSWQKIIRVLTHEIMSSISPVTALSEHLLKKIQDSSRPELDKEVDGRMLEDLKEGLEIIHSRGEGLMEFVRHYHSLTHLPIPVLEEVQLSPFLHKILNLVEPECRSNNISVELDVGEDILLSIDSQLIEQVLLNLVRNSIQALEGIEMGKKITILAGRVVSGIQISVRDNGCGIDMESMDNIFIPFFTTREKGSGIGLSFAKQIMRLHNGQISVKSEKGEGAEFILRF